MATEVSSPFLQAPSDNEGLQAFRSIDSWPSQVQEDSLDNLDVHSAGQALQTFRAMPASVQNEFAEYPGIVKLGFRNYAESGDAGSTLEWFIRQIPSMLFRPDRTGYIPIEAALESGNGAAVRVLMDVADRAGMLKRLLGYRNPRYGHTLLMLAVQLNSRDCSDIFQKLMNFDPTSLHRCYDCDGRNVFHRCTEFGLSTSLQIIFGLLIEYPDLYSCISASQLKEALKLPDTKKNTPIHYICAAGKIEMLDSIAKYLTHSGLKINFDACFKSSTSLTPLMLAVQSGHFEVCKWLLENGSVDVHFKQHSTCLTALHFAVRAGNPELISLLMKHGAAPEFCDAECDSLEGYKTPLELAETENIVNKLACIKCLRRN